MKSCIFYKHKGCDILAIIELQLEIFIIVVCGLLLAKRGVIDISTRKKMTDIVIDLILPCAIIKSFAMKMTMDIIKGTIVVFFISVIIQLFYSALNRFLYNRFDESQALIMKYATIVSNAGFMGLPIVESVYGTQGLLYASIALIPQRIFMWSSGLSLFTKTDKKSVIKTLAVHPCIIAVYIGFIVMGLESMGVSLPGFVMKTVNAIGGCTTAISMLIIGAILSDVEWKELVEKVGLYFSFIRLLVIPIVIYCVLTLCHVDSLVVGVSVLLSAMPAGSTSAMLAQKYDKDVKFASKLVVISTVLSLFTLPIISLIVS